MVNALANRFAVALTVVVFGLAHAQISGQSNRGTLELALQVKDFQMGVPQTFIFTLINKTDHEVRIPYIPNIDCNDTLNGAMWLRFTAPGPQSVSRGCGTNVVGGETIWSRIKGWKVLSPGASLSFKAGRERGLYSDQMNGTYEFWAHYEPPQVSLKDQDLLRQAGIGSPRVPLDSPHIKFEKK
jgi:hypothetical protein